MHLCSFGRSGPNPSNVTISLFLATADAHAAPMIPTHVRKPLVAVGTRVVLLRADNARAHGAVTEVRREPFLRSYVVTLDDARVLFCSQHELALEGDASCSPLAEAIEY
jgi:hypothetical protein